jgi:hypothetical protein
MRRIVIAAAGLALGLALVSTSTAPDAEAFSGEVFEITGGATQFHFESQPAPGKGAFVNKITPATVVACINGSNPSDGCAPFLEQDAGGKAYILFDSLTSWRIATKSDGTNATTLTGLVDGAGAFTFAGKHVKSGSNVMLTGKVKFQKGTYTPLSISGKVIGVSTLTRHFVTGTFKTVGSKKN